MKRLREHGVSNVCPQCRAPMLPGPVQCYDEAALLAVRAGQMGHSSGEQEQAHALCAQAMGLLEQVLQEEPDHLDAQICFAICSDKIGQCEKAVQLYRKVADLGHDHAQCNLGTAYERGAGVPKDILKALEWWRKAAKQKNVRATYNLGACYASGTGVHKDAGKAAEWLRKAAELGHTQAQYHVGGFYRRGEGVPRDAGKAVKWYREAAGAGARRCTVRARCVLPARRGCE
jgi:TPR repeat protein